MRLPFCLLFIICVVIFCLFIFNLLNDFAGEVLDVFEGVSSTEGKTSIFG